MEELINDYERKIKAINELLEQQNDIIAIKRLKIKRGCYRSFIFDLKRAMADSNNESAALSLHGVIISLPTRRDYDKRKLPMYYVDTDVCVGNAHLYLKGDKFDTYHFNYDRLIGLLREGILTTERK